MFGGERRRFVYRVQLQLESGQLEEVPYSVFWDPEKVPSGEVASACAAELRAAGRSCVGVSAVLS